MMECPYCKEIALPEPDGGDCEDCGLTSYFGSPEESNIGFWHWMYNHDFIGDHGWIVRTIIGLVRRVGRLSEA